MYSQILKQVEEVNPLVHCITNYVTVNDCANILLACKSSPIMADDIQEVEEITSISNSLVLNIGTLNHRQVESMILAGKKANELGHPIIFDPVGAGASRLRTQTAERILSEMNVDVIRGNPSEIKALSGMDGTTKGVDVAVGDSITEATLDKSVDFAKEMSKKTGAVIVMTGKIDIVAKDEKAYVIYNGHPSMGKITGTGCMLTSVIGGFCGACPESLWEAAMTAVVSMGICGEMAFEKMREQDGGYGSMKMYLMDFMSKMNEERIRENEKVESR